MASRDALAKYPIGATYPCISVRDATSERIPFFVAAFSGSHVSFL